ncbi:MAG: hypothetical protein K0S01_3393 [Herbinix sp.]|nr:hypothetical protein [Herbinix sp.]
MNIVSYVVGYSIYGIESFIWWRLTNSVLVSKYDKKYPMGAAIIMFAMMLMKDFIFRLPNIPQLQVIGTIVLMGYTFIMGLFLFKNSFLEKLIWWGIYYFGLIIMELVTILLLSLVMNTSIQDITTDNTTSLWIIALAKIMTVLIFEAIIRKRKGKLVIGFSYFNELSFVIIFSIVLLLGTVFIFSNTNNIASNIDNIILFFFGIMLFIAIFIISLIFKIEKKSKEEMETKLKLQQIELEVKLNEDMISITDKLRKLRHDMNNHIGLIKTLVHTEKYEDLKEYIDQIYEDVEVANELVITENKTLSVLLNTKKSKAREKNIDFQSMIAMQNFQMQNKDICALLGNILDNAIEAAEKANNKYIQLTIQKTSSGCVISCENSFGVKPVMRKGKFITSKEDAFIHGIGTENIKDIVAKYKGEVSFDFDDEMFNVRVVMPA